MGVRVELAVRPPNPLKAQPISTDRNNDYQHSDSQLESREMNFLCKLGLHRWDTREVHVTEPATDKWTIQAAIIERCACGESRVPPSGGPKTTRFFVHDKFSGAQSPAQSADFPDSHPGT